MFKGMGKVMLASTALGPQIITGSVIREVQGTNSSTGKEWRCQRCNSHNKRSASTSMLGDPMAKFGN
jgi:hypothetical protein